MFQVIATLPNIQQCSHKLVMNLHECAVAAIECLADLCNRTHPIEKPFGFFGTHVDTAVTHRGSKIVMPVCAMEGVTLRSEETRPRHAGQLIIFETSK